VAHNLTIIQGATFSVAWPITDANGQPIDMTDWTIRSQIRAAIASPVVLHEFSTALGNATIDAGRVVITVRPIESTAWTWRRGVYDVELTDLLGRVARISEGHVKVSPEVTR
jgi:hypothetical protein